jgi:hypothetical protein
MRVSLDSADPRISQYNQHRNSSTINFSLYTPDSPTAVYDFEEIARAFPLPTNTSNILSQRPGKDRNVDPLDFPVEIALADEEEELGRELESNSGGSRRGSESWMNKDLAAWRSQCHRDANLSATSLPVAAERYPGAADKRNPSVISLPTVMPELSDSTATSATFALSPIGDEAFVGIQQDHRIESLTRGTSASAMSREAGALCEDEHETSPRNSQGKTIRCAAIIPIFADLKMHLSLSAYTFTYISLTFQSLDCGTRIALDVPRSIVNIIVLESTPTSSTGRIAIKNERKRFTPFHHITLPVHCLSLSIVNTQSSNRFDG